jgi:hypothetical protein
MNFPTLRRRMLALAAAVCVASVAACSDQSPTDASAPEDARNGASMMQPPAPGTTCTTEGATYGDLTCRGGMWGSGN